MDTSYLGPFAVTKYGAWVTKYVWVGILTREPERGHKRDQMGGVGDIM